MKSKSSPLARLQHHVTGAIERGEAQAIEGIPASTPLNLCPPTGVTGTTLPDSPVKDTPAETEDEHTGATAVNGDEWTGERDGEWWNYRAKDGSIYESREVPVYRIKMDNAKQVLVDGKLSIAPASPVASVGVPVSAEPYLTPDRDQDPMGVYRFSFADDLERRFNEADNSDDEDGSGFEAIHAENNARLAEILTAVNSHAAKDAKIKALVDALEAAAVELDILKSMFPLEGPHRKAARDKVHAALALTSAHLSDG